MENWVICPNRVRWGLEGRAVALFSPYLSTSCCGPSNANQFHLEWRRHELRSSPHVGDLGSDASLRPRVCPLPGLGAAGAPFPRTNNGARLPPARRDPLLRGAANGVHGRRSAEAAGSI